MVSISQERALKDFLEVAFTLADLFIACVLVYGFFVDRRVYHLRFSHDPLMKNK